MYQLFAQGYWPRLPIFAPHPDAIGASIISFYGGGGLCRMKYAVA